MIQSNFKLSIFGLCPEKNYLITRCTRSGFGLYDYQDKFLQLLPSHIFAINCLSTDFKKGGCYFVGKFYALDYKNKKLFINISIFFYM